MLHALRLRGLLEPEAVAELYDLDPALVDDVLATELVEGRVERRLGRIGGYRLTPVGREEGERLLRVELDRAGARAEVESVYDRFRAVNGEFVAVCTDWQLRTVEGRQEYNDHEDADHDRQVVARLEAIDDVLAPLLAEMSSVLDRFRIYPGRFAEALDHIRDGRIEFFTKPMFPSYHTLWFELHEDLLATLGIDRSVEASS